MLSVVGEKQRMNDSLLWERMLQMNTSGIPRGLKTSRQRSSYISVCSVSGPFPPGSGLYVWILRVALVSRRFLL